MDMNYYEILGLPQDASKDDINKAYRTLIIKYHPDVRGESGKTFTEYLNVIHDTLLDDDRRKAYDESLPHGNHRHHEANQPRTHEHDDDDDGDDDQVNLDEPPTTTPQRHQEPASDEQSSPAWLSISQALIMPSAITVLVAMIVVLFRGRGLVYGVWSFACIIILLTLILMGSMVWHWPLFMLAMLVMADDAVFGMVMGGFHDAGVKDDASR